MTKLIVTSNENETMAAGRELAKEILRDDLSLQISLQKRLQFLLQQFRAQAIQTFQIQVNNLSEGSIKQQ